MINESCYWKDDLLKKAAWLRLRENQQRWTASSIARIEQVAMLGFYSIRKLIEAKKIADAIACQSISLSAYTPTGKIVTRQNWHHILELYDFESPKKTTHDLMFLCNQFVHSYIFNPVFCEENTLQAILVSSDRERTSCLYELSIQTMISLFEQVGRDYPNEVTMIFNEQRNDYDISSITHAPNDPLPKGTDAWADTWMNHK